MISFLRKLRLQLLEVNKTGTYLKYAIGEIFLVVIGILIAFTINNWNIGRLERIEERKLLQNVKVDFEKAIRTFERLNIRRDESLEAFSMLHEVARGGDFRNEAVIDTLLGKTNFTPTYNGKSGSLSVLLNSGKINILSNDSLKTLLLEWPQEIDDMTEGELDTKSLTLELLQPLIRKHVAVNDMIRHLPIKEIPFDKRKTRIKKNYSALFDDPQFENLITTLEFYYVVGKRETNSLIQLAESIIEIIDEELAG